jgi:hypothetical protein
MKHGMLAQYAKKQAQRKNAIEFMQRTLLCPHAPGTNMPPDA